MEELQGGYMAVSFVKHLYIIVFASYTFLENNINNKARSTDTPIIGCTIS